MYDIYLSVGCDKLPDLGALPHHLFLTKELSESTTPSPSFLGLSLSGDVAADLLELLVLAGGYGYLVPVCYRQPKVSAQLAMPIAYQAIVQKQKKYFPSYSFEPVQFWREGAMWWEFGAASEELGKSGHIPGCVSARVDKLDGHLWTAQEEVSLHAHGEEYYLESATTLTPEQLLESLASKFTLAWGTDYMQPDLRCLKGPALVMGAFKQSYPAVSEKLFGFRSSLRLWFRIIPYKSGYEGAPLLMLRAVMNVLRHDSEEAVLTFDDGELAILLKQTKGQLVLGEKWSSWVSNRAVPSNLYELMRLGKSTQGKERWNGQLRYTQPKVQRRAERLAMVSG